jgi:hypothetical protein
MKLLQPTNRVLSRGEGSDWEPCFATGSRLSHHQAPKAAQIHPCSRFEGALPSASKWSRDPISLIQSAEDEAVVSATVKSIKVRDGMAVQIEDGNRK